MKRPVSVVVAIAAAAAVTLAIAGRTSPDPGATFIWAGDAGEPLEADVFARVVRRQGIQEQTLAELASTPADGGQREIVVTGRRYDGAAMIAPAWARAARLIMLGEFAPVTELGLARVWPKGVHSLAGWDAKREVVANHAVVRFEADGGPSPDRVGWSSVVGIVRSDVTRLVAELADGSRRELPLSRWRGFGYRARPATAALTLLAYDRDGTILERAELSRPSPLCGGAYGPCDPELAQYLD